MQSRLSRFRPAGVQIQLRTSVLGRRVYARVHFTNHGELPYAIEHGAIRGSEGLLRSCFEIESQGMVAGFRGVWGAVDREPYRILNPGETWGYAVRLDRYYGFASEEGRSYRICYVWANHRQDGSGRDLLISNTEEVWVPGRSSMGRAWDFVANQRPSCLLPRGLAGRMRSL